MLSEHESLIMGRLVYEAIRFIPAENRPMARRPEISHQEPIEVCAWLADNQEALRVTSAGPDNAVSWLLADGCPEDTVRPDQWLVGLSDQWQRNT